jgi:hypothetical protein
VWPAEGALPAGDAPPAPPPAGEHEVPTAQLADEPAPVARPKRLARARRRFGIVVRHRATQVVAALVIGLGLGAGGMAIIAHATDSDAGQTTTTGSTGDNDFGAHGHDGHGGGR